MSKMHSFSIALARFNELAPCLVKESASFCFAGIHLNICNSFFSLKHLFNNSKFYSKSMLISHCCRMGILIK